MKLSLLSQRKFAREKQEELQKQLYNVYAARMKMLDRRKVNLKCDR